MKCLECGKTFAILSVSHLKSCCGLTPKEYKEKHGVRYLADEHLRCAGESNPNYKDGATYKDVYCIDCGKQIMARRNAKYCSSCANKGERNGFNGRKHSAVTRMKMKRSAALRDKSTYRYGNAPSHVLSARMKEIWASKTPEQRAKHLANYVSVGRKACRKASNTKIEQKIKVLLKSMGLKFKQNVEIKGTLFNVDFIIEGCLIIECYGDYWHCNPKIYDDIYFNASLKMTAGDKWLKDRKRLREIRRVTGFETIVVWESHRFTKHLSNKILRKLNIKA